MKIAIIGYGGRGRLYSDILKNNQDAEIVAICDCDNEKLDLAHKELGINNEALFANENDFFACEKMADILFVCTQDELHFGHAIKGLEKGYDLLLEKPIACSMEECQSIQNKAEALGRNIFVCHVLRYTPFYMEIKRQLDSGKFGKVISLSTTENVAYWHQAHSYVRGNWNNDNRATPMIIAKCCHDLDLISWFMDDICESVSSFGSLSIFKEENAPQESAAYCLDCNLKEICPYSAEKIYIKDRAEKGKLGWPCDIIVNEPTVEKLYSALKTSKYGRCVYKCDNNVVDHQVVNLQFKNGGTAQLTMTAFSEECFREIRLHCENGDIAGNMVDNILTCNIFGKETYKIDVNVASDTDYGHGGGDLGMMQTLIDFYKGKSKLNTTIAESMQSHYMGFAAEKSRKENGNVIRID
jgi:predicted dehydrogenase